MVDQVAKALCEFAGRSTCDACEEGETRSRLAPVCVCCERQPDGSMVCNQWTSFRIEAQAAIVAAHAWHRQNHRWPGWLK